VSNKLALILLGVWTMIVILGCGGAFWYVGTQVPWHERDKRASAMGAGTVTCIGYGAILLPWAIAWHRRREERERTERDGDMRLSGRLCEPSCPGLTQTEPLPPLRQPAEARRDC